MILIEFYAQAHKNTRKNKQAGMSQRLPLRLAYNLKQVLHKKRLSVYNSYTLTVASCNVLTNKLTI